MTTDMQMPTSAAGPPQGEQWEILAVNDLCEDC